MTDIDFGISRLEKVSQYLEDLYEPLRRGVYMVIFSGPSGAKHYIDNELFHLPPYSVLYLGPERMSHFDRNVHEDTYILVFSSRFYNRSYRDIHYLQNSPLFFDLNRIYYLTPPAEVLMYCKVLVSLLYRARDNFEKQLNRDLAHNLVQQILIMGTMLHDIVPIRDFKNNQEQVLALKYRELVAKHFKTNRTVKFYADLLNITERKLNKATENIFGISAKDLIVYHIMREAKRLLSYSDLTIKEISFDLGFSEENNFSTFFSKNESRSPRQYRNNNKLKVVA